MILQLSPLSVLDLVGKDAAAILNNLTTNAVKALQPSDPGVETFITNLKGKCVGHVMVFRTEEGYRLIGAGGQSEAIAALMDRYTVREEAVPRIMDTQLQALLATEPSVPAEDSASLRYDVPWLGAQRAVLMLAPASDSEPAETADAAQTLRGDAGLEAFHGLRVAAGYPWYGIDFDDSHLPQEVSREAQTISFTKGCYLGQETIARLDALGQVQKKLVKWSLESGLGAGDLPAVDTKLFAAEEPPATTEAPAKTNAKPVGRLTSIARDPSQPERVWALGFARRSHFEPGAEAVGMNGSKEFAAKVVKA